LRAHGYETGAFISTAALHRRTNILQGCDTIEEVWRLPHNQRFTTATERAVTWIKKPRQSPFFAWVHYNNAHQPYRPVGTPPNLFVGDKFYDPTRRIRVNISPLSLNIPQGHPYAIQILRPDIGGVRLSALLKKNPDELAYYIARHDACIYGADHMAGNLLREVQKMGLLENMIVVVVSDHGEALGGHNYYFGHGRLPYNDCARVPLIIRPIGGVKSARVQTPVAIFGLAPTLLDMVGIKTPKEMEASSFFSIAYGKDKGDYVFMESGYQLDFTLSVWAGKWKLIHIPNEIDRLLMNGCEYELYNLEEDPHELNNLYATEPKVAAKLQQVLQAWSEPWVKRAYSAESITDVEIDEKTIQRLRSLGYLP
ncbi:MAG: sulfatase family protein, partial [Planctomycetota bacterium]